MGFDFRYARKGGQMHSFFSFIPVKIRSLFPNSILPCDFYFPTITEQDDEIRPEKVLLRGDPYTEEIHLDFLRKGIDSVYIEPQHENEFFNYLNSETQKLLILKETPTERKTELLYDNAESLVTKVFRESPNESNILVGRQLIDSISYHFRSDKISASSVLSLFSKDYRTFNHCIQVAILGMLFSKFLGWGASEINDLGIGSLFHDIGKNLISEEILNKPGKLDREEFEMIKQHPLWGYQQLKNTNVLSKSQLAAVLFHHEATDGSGYLDGLFGNTIPFYARVAHIVDVFDALTSRRAYKEALSRQEALHLMKTEMGSSFDEELLHAFVQFIEGPAVVDEVTETRLLVEIGTAVSLQRESTGNRIKAILIGIEHGKHLILSIPDKGQFQELSRNLPLIVRYFHAGEACGFKSRVIETLSKPSFLALITYPKNVEKLTLRSEPRIECFLPASLQVQGRTLKCVVIDLSLKGCKVRMKATEGAAPLIMREKAVVLGPKLPGTNEVVHLQSTVRTVDKIDGGYLIGIQFGELSPMAADRWQSFINDIMEFM